jgi:hypothetical protein
MRVEYYLKSQSQIHYLVRLMKTHQIILIILLLVIFTTICAAEEEPTNGLIGGGPGYYDISSYPDGATVMFDGKYKGTTPATVEVSSSGTPGHTISLSLAGYQPWSKYYSGNPFEGETIHVDATLVPVPVTLPTTIIGGGTGYYDISSEPDGASVLFDGKNKGTTPVTVDVSSTGTPGHTISLSLAGFQPWSKYYSGNPFEGETIHVDATLVPVSQFGTISVASSPSGAYATLDNGLNSLTTPGTFYGVDAGWHNVRVSMPGYRSYAQDVQIASGGAASVYANLAPYQQTGRISVSSNPSGAGLYIDSIYQGETTQNVGNLATGSHSVTLRKAGYQTWSGTYNVASGQTTFVNAGLVPLNNPSTGDLEVSSSPAGAAVYVDGNYQGTTVTSHTIDVLGLSPGAHTVLLKKTGYQDFITSSVIQRGQISQVSATLSPTGQPASSASIQVTSDPAGADVYINNAYVGITPLTLQNIQTGSSAVTVSLQGYQSYTTTVQVNPGQAVLVNAALSPVATPTTKAPVSMSGAVLAVVIGGLAVLGTARKDQ